MDVPKILDSLSTKRPIFHSEADFQHALAWEIQCSMPEAKVRLERPFETVGGTMYMDVSVETLDGLYTFELKYKTKATEVQVLNEAYKLRSHSANDSGRYDYVKDVLRLERICSQRLSLVGFAVLLTNDDSYWREIGAGKAGDSAFRLNENRILTGELAWGVGLAPGSIKGRERPLHLLGSYNLNWRQYSNVGTSKGLSFRCLVVGVLPCM